MLLNNIKYSDATTVFVKSSTRTYVHLSIEYLDFLRYQIK